MPWFSLSCKICLWKCNDSWMFSISWEICEQQILASLLSFFRTQIFPYTCTLENTFQLFIKLACNYFRCNIMIFSFVLYIVYHTKVKNIVIFYNRIKTILLKKDLVQFQHMFHSLPVIFLYLAIYIYNMTQW